VQWQHYPQESAVPSSHIHEMRLEIQIANPTRRGFDPQLSGVGRPRILFREEMGRDDTGVPGVHPVQSIPDRIVQQCRQFHPPMVSDLVDWC